MLVLTKDAYFLCEHEGRADPEARQSFVRIDDVPVLVYGDPVGRTIRNCKNYNPPAGIKPCVTTLKVDKGYSAFVRISGQPICLSSVEGLTDGTPPAQVHYSVHRSGQDWVRGE
jgi:hypothetical protein